MCCTLGRVDFKVGPRPVLIVHTLHMITNKTKKKNILGV